MEWVKFKEPGKLEFKPWSKTPRLFRDCVITEKIDGTNAAIGFMSIDDIEDYDYRVERPEILGVVDEEDEDGVLVDEHACYAQSRSRLLTLEQDNYGFARWVSEHRDFLFELLGPGLHYGEWWGQGINRGYGLDKKRFSLFNTSRHGHLNDDPIAKALGVATVPVLYTGPFSTVEVHHQAAKLAGGGSVASPGFADPEGVVTFHTASNLCFKTTIKNDESPKGKQ